MMLILDHFWQVIYLTMSLVPSSDELSQQYGREIGKVKAISDEIIYHPVKYKVLFRSNRNDNHKLLSQVVKNPEAVVNDNDVKVRIISNAINRYFHKIGTLEKRSLLN